MASSGSGIHDDSFYHSSGGADGATATGDLRTISPQMTTSSFSNAGERSSVDTSHHHVSFRDGNWRDR